MNNLDQRDWDETEAEQRQLLMRRNPRSNLPRTFRLLTNSFRQNYREHFDRLWLPVSMVCGAVLLGFVIFYGLGTIFAKPSGFEIAVNGVDQLKIGAPVFHGGIQIGHVRGLKEQRGGTVADLAIDKQYVKLIAESREFGIRNRSGNAPSVVVGAEARTNSATDRIAESVGQFSVARAPPIFFYVVLAVVAVITAWAAKMVLNIAQSAIKVVGFALVVGIVVVAGLILAGQFKGFG